MTRKNADINAARPSADKLHVAVGLDDGSTLGIAVGDTVGLTDGTPVGTGVGLAVGDGVVGAAEAVTVGLGVEVVGDCVGD